MALLEIQLTTNSKAIDFHKGTADVVGITSDDSYRFITALVGYETNGDEIKILFSDSSRIVFNYDQVEQIGLVTSFSSSQDVLDAIEILLSL
jgi:hypothetical protein